MSRLTGVGATVPSMEERLTIPAARTSLPRWEYTADCVVVGWVEEVRIGRSTRRFYRAVGVHPATGHHVVLEVSADREERVRVMADFHENPEAYARHIR
jgi:hypothetical protein